jgi:predicted  nucleic acid-binding Zn-ribbon protein
VNADPAAQLRLLDLQAADTALAQLAHRRRTLPETAQLVEHATRIAEVADQLLDARTIVADIELEQRRLDNDVETVRNRAARDEARLQAGGLPSRELESLQHEIATLARRQSTLEDELLDVMERGETAERTLSELTERHEALLAEQRELEERRDAAFTEIDAAIAERTPQRAAIAAEVPADLLALYERARTQTGTGAALLKQRRCEACHIELSGTELAAARSAAPDAVIRCDNCRAVLVRTAESGL